MILQNIIINLYVIKQMEIILMKSSLVLSFNLKAQI